MKTIKILSILLFLLICPRLSFTQGITVDTALANSYFEKANIYKDSSQYDSAIVYFEKASVLYQKHEQWRKYLISETKHGECYQKLWQLDNSIEKIKSAIESTLKHLDEIDTIFSEAYHYSGLAYVYKSQLDSAIYCWKKALEIKLELYGEKHIYISNSYNNLGNVYLNKADYDRALDYYFKSLQIRKELLGEKHLLVSDSYNNMANVYASNYEYDLALEYYFKSQKIYKELLGEKHINLAKNYNNLGYVYSAKNEYDLSLEYHFKALQIRKELLGEKNPDVAVSYINIGVVYSGKDENDLALENYFHAIQILKELFGEKHIYLALSYRNIGSIYSSKKEYDLALEYHFNSLMIYKELLGEKHPDVAGSYINIGSVYGDTDVYDFALEYYHKALLIFKELFGEKHLALAGINHNIGNIYLDKREYDKALGYYKSSMQIRIDLLGEKHTEVADSYNNIANTHADKNNYDLALEYYNKSLQIYLELFGEKHTKVAISYNNIATVYEGKKEYYQTLQYYQKAIASSLRSFHDTVNVYLVPPIAEYNNWNELLRVLNVKARKIVEHQKSIKTLNVAMLHYLACDTLISQVRKEMKTKSDKIALGEQASNIYANAVNVCMDLSMLANPDSVTYYKKLAFYFSEKNKSSVLLEALAGVEAQKFAGIPDSLLNKEHNLQIDIAQNKQILSEQTDSLNEALIRDKLFKANRQYDELIKVFEDQYPQYFDLKYSFKPVSVSEIQETLDNKTALISYFTGDSIITIFTITNKNLDVKIVPALKNFADTIKYFRNGLINTSNSDNAKVYKKYAYKLNKLLIPKNLKNKIKNLIIIPDAELSMIPFETLLTEEPKNKDWKKLHYLIKKYNISYSYSVNLFHKTLPKEPTTKIENTLLNDWIAFAPVFDDSNTAGLTIRTRELFEQLDIELDDTTGTRGNLINGGYVSPLPGTENEVRSIFEEFNKKDKKALVQIKENANEGFIKSGELKKYRLLHFATHGFVNTKRPELSGLFLAQDSTINEDGILYSGEIFNLKLNADLTVLSACETGLGEIKKGEGLIGLTRALLYAGSKNIIVSLWKVADNSTSELMINFYKNLLEDKKEKKEFSQALRKAKLKMIDDGKYAHPFYWSPFILIGK